MGYHLTILRTNAGKSLPITEAEFAAAVARIPSLRLDDDQRSARYVRGGELRSTLSLSEEGEVWTNTAEEDVLSVMLELAAPLKARVRGDENETYRSVSDAYVHPDDAEEVEAAETERRAHRKRRLIWNVVRIVALVVVLILIVTNTCRK